MWYSVKLLYSSEIDGQKNDLFEETIVLISAENQEEALKKAIKTGREKQILYKNSDDEEVRWFFNKVVEVQDLCEKKIYSGMEIFSRLFRHKPEE